MTVQQVKRKNEALQKQTMKKPKLFFKHLLLDIEGTTTPLAFVHQVLFPYVRDNLRRFLETHYNEEELQEHLKELYKQSEIDKLEFPIVMGTKEETIDSMIQNITSQMDADRKIKSLKSFQGYMWRFAYESEEIKGLVYPDVVEFIKDKDVSIYSSGSIDAQKLLFKYSDQGDLTSHFKNHFDTTIGSKLEADSYVKIANELGLEPIDILFLSDNIKELEAAKKANMNAILVKRPGNNPVPEHDFHSIETFLEIDHETTRKEIIKEEKIKQLEDSENKVEL